MTVYRGTEGPDRIDQFVLNLPSWTDIYGQGGDDWIRVGFAVAEPGAGNDTVIGTEPNWSSVAYWGARAPITVDLQAGFAEDGLGGRDSLHGIYVVHDGSFNDTILGSSRTDKILFFGGSNFVDGRGGLDVVRYFASSSEFSVRLAISGQVEVLRNATGQTDVLQNIESIEFNDRIINALNHNNLIVTNVYSQDGFAKDGFAPFAGAADLNKDGKTDIVIAGSVFPPAPAVATIPFVLIQNGSGNFSQNDSFIMGPRHGLVHPREMAFADLNSDGLLDVVIAAHGYDAAPFAGERSSLLLSANGGLVDASSNLPSENAFTHSVAVGDVNRDGALDIFWGNMGIGPAPRLLINSGSGLFNQGGTLPLSLDTSRANASHYNCGIFIDLNNDGRMELVLGTSQVAASAVLSQDALGRFTDEGLRPLPPGRFGAQSTIVVDVVATDLNRDGRLDLLLSQTRAEPFYADRAIQALVQTSDGGFVDETAMRFPRFDLTQFWLSFLTMVDVNRDGHLDIVGTGTDTQSSNVYVNDGTGRFNAAGPDAGYPDFAAGFLLPGVAGELYNVYAIRGSDSHRITVDRIEATENIGTGPSGIATAAAGAPGFNEGYYRNENPDVVMTCPLRSGPPVK